jgi:hypothetical protein
MWRPAHGATSRPGPCRPASGYGREVGRPGPHRGEPVVGGGPTCALEPAWFVECPDSGADADADAPTPVTP